MTNKELCSLQKNKKNNAGTQGKRSYLVQSTLIYNIPIVFEGGALASIVDPEEQNFIQDQLLILSDGQSSFWIGLYKTHAGIEFTSNQKLFVYPFLLHIK